MTTYGLYLSRALAARFVVLLVFGALFALGVVLVDETRDVLRTTDGTVRALALYSALRLPDLVSLMIPIAALLAGLLAFGDQRRHRELMAIWAAGASPYRILAALLPAAAVLAVLQFAVDDRLVPASAEALRAWGVDSDRRQGPMRADLSVVWLRSGDDIVRIGAVAPGAATLERVTIFRRTPEGGLSERLDAARAVRDGAAWRLEEVVRRDLAGDAAERHAALRWEGRIPVEAAEVLARDPRDLPLDAIAHLVAERAYGQRSVALYETWYNARLARAVTAGAVLLLAAALAQRYSRGGGMAWLLVGGLALGFAVFVFDGVAVALGEVAVVPAAAAGWAGVAVLLLLIAWFAIQQEPGVGRGR